MAQVVAHLIGSEEVTGPSPVSSFWIAVLAQEECRMAILIHRNEMIRKAKHEAEERTRGWTKKKMTAPNWKD